MTVRRRARRTGELRGVSPCSQGENGRTAAHRGVQAAGDVLSVEDVDEVVTPLPVDVQVPRTQALLAEAELLHDPTRGDVLRPDVDLDAVQPEPEPSVIDANATALGITPRPATASSTQ